METKDLQSTKAEKAIKNITQTCKMIKTVYQKYIKASTRVRLEATSGPMTKGVPNNNQRGDDLVSSE